MHYPKVMLGDCLTVLTDYHSNGSYERLRENVKLLDDPDYAVMIRTTNFEKNDFVYGLKYIDKHAYNFLRKSKVHPGDILMNKIASPGSVFRMPDLGRPVSLAMNLFLLRTDEARLNQTYAYYWLKANERYVKSFACGAATATITKKAVRELEILLPEISTQREIVGVLLAYESLIENCQRRIQILDSMARALYRDWFVELRFPGHKELPRVASPLGDIPKGWEVSHIGEVSKCVLGGTPSRSINEYWIGGTIPWLKSGKLNDIRVIEGTEFITARGLEMSATKLMPRKTVLIAITGAILVSLLEIEACANQSVIGIYDLSKVCAEYLHLYLSENISVFESKMSGSAQQHINKEIVRHTPVLIPSKIVADNFRSIVQPLYEEIALILFKKRNLAMTRDLLLPRLISGEIPLKDNEKFAKETM